MRIEDRVHRPAPAPPAPVDPTRRGAQWPEFVLVAALVVAALLVRRPWQRQPAFWFDEAWVADSLRVSLGQLAHPRATGSTRP
jgi:hypothetical protein